LLNTPLALKVFETGIDGGGRTVKPQQGSGIIGFMTVPRPSDN